MIQAKMNKVNKRGAVIIPADLRRRFGIVAGSFVIAEARAEGILLRPAATPGEDYTPDRKAEFILGSALDAEDYAQAAAEVRAMGLDPDTIPHHKPAGV